MRSSTSALDRAQPVADTRIDVQLGVRQLGHRLPQEIDTGEGITIAGEQQRPDSSMRGQCSVRCSQRSAEPGAVERVAEQESPAGDLGCSAASMRCHSPAEGLAADDCRASVTAAP